MGDWAKVRAGHWPFNDSALTVIPMKDVPASLEYFYISLLFKQLTDRASGSGHAHGLQRLIIFDEGRVFFGREFEPGAGSGRSNIQTEMATRGRSYETGFVVATQDMAVMQPSLVNNAATFISMRTHSSDEAKLFCRRHGLPEKQYHRFMELPKGRAVISSPEYPRPVEFQVPFHDLGDYPAETEIADRMAPVWNQWDANAVFAPVQDNIVKLVNFHELLGECEPPTQHNSKISEIPEPVSSPVEQEAASDYSTPSDPQIISEYFELMRCCQASKELGVTALYRSLGWSGGRGNRVKNKLLELGWVTAARITSPKGGRPKETLLITEKGKEVLNERA
ncbi:hypothetical protein P4E94_18620 [Pontiellaceae bacterium B12219]|nr:hypothetical protein [Pontiellaceae bacterium B12219]